MYNKSLIYTSFLLLDSDRVSRFNPRGLQVPSRYSMEKLTEILAMDGYAVYVWPSFIIAAIVMLGMVIISMRSLRRAQRTLAELQASVPLSRRNEA